MSRLEFLCDGLSLNSFYNNNFVKKSGLVASEAGNRHFVLFFMAYFSWLLSFTGYRFSPAFSGKKQGLENLENMKWLRRVS